jgi:hypothetical protein
MEDNSGENKKSIFDLIADGMRFAQEKKRITAQKKADYKKTRANNELLRTRILSVLPIGKGRKGMKCREVTDQINNRFFDYRNIPPKKLGEKISQMLGVLNKQGKSKQKNGYWKRT